jgi:KDO2-lipid IV(A) lauroyltransferase
VIAHLPYSIQIGLGKILGYAFYYLASFRRYITRTNIDVCFPLLNDKERERLTKAAFISNAIALIESTMCWWINAETWRSRVIIEGFEHLKAAEQQGKGVLLIGAHFSTLDIAGSLLSLFIQFDVTYRENKNPLFDAFINTGRSRHFKEVIHRHDTRKIIRCLKNNDIVWFAPDQDYGAKHSVFAPFFGTPAATITSATRLINISGAVPLFISYYRHLETRSYSLHIQPINDYPSFDDIQDATFINSLIEEAIKKHPDQYLWQHRRFKTRPAGATKIYKVKKRP